MNVQATGRTTGVLLLAASIPITASAALVDNFEGNTIDFDAWRTYDSPNATELVRHIDSEHDELILHSASSGQSGLLIGSGRSLVVVNRDQAEAIEALLEVESVNPGSGDQCSEVSVDGTYYNADSSDAQADNRIGDIHAGVTIGDCGDGLEAYYAIVESTNPDFTEWDIVAEGQIIPPGSLSLGTAYRTEVSYDGSTNFTFEVDGNSETADGPDRLGNAGVDNQRIVASTHDGNDPVSITARIDKAWINNADVPDDFFGPRLDASNWSNTYLDYSPNLVSFLEGFRAVDNGKLRLDIRGHDLGESFGPRQRLIVSDTDNPDYIEAKVSIPSESDLDDNVYSNVGITGYLYNEDHDGSDGNPYNGAEGDVWGSVYLRELNGEIQGRAYLESENSDFSFREQLFFDTFTKLLAYDTEYTLSMAREDDEIVFRLDGEELRHNIGTSAFPPSPEAALNGYRAVRTRIFGNASGTDGGIARATFDDVRTSPSSSRGPGDDSGDADGGGGMAGTGLLLIAAALLGIHRRLHG